MQFANFYLILPTAFFALYAIKQLSTENKSLNSFKKIKKKIKARIIHNNNATQDS